MDFDTLGLVVVGGRNDLVDVSISGYEGKGLLASIISSRGKESSGMSAALHAMR